jgi:hypothetical protein
MSKIDELLKGNAPLYTVLGVVLSGGGLNLYSESAEEVERESEAQQRQQHDFIQDTKHDALLALVNELRIEMARREGQQ